MLKKKEVDLTNATLIEAAYATTGSYRKAARIVAFVHSWRVVRKKLGRRPSVEEYAEYWKESAATGYRSQAIFREAFPHAQTPDDLPGEGPGS